MRTFIALDISDETRSAVMELTAELKGRVAGARWLPPANLHLTLRFLGPTDERTVEKLSQELESTSQCFGPFQLTFRGFRAFPSPRRPRVLCAAIARPPEELERLHHDVEGVVRKLGFAPEKRAFAPHLTFARVRNPSGEYRSLESELKERDFGVSTIEAMALYQSVLKPSGAVYHRLKQFPFEGRRDDR